MLELISKDHKHWVRVAKGYGSGEYAEDIVQEMYLKASKIPDSKLLTNGELNGGYIRFMIMSLSYDFYKAKKKIDKVGIGEGFEIEQEINEEDVAYGRFLKRLDAEMDSWEWFERDMFKLYVGTHGTQNIKTHGEKISLRKFSEESGISIMTIFKTLKRCKDRIRENLSEDWEDFINGDIERI